MTSTIADSVLQFREVVARTLPEDTTIAVVSRGDGDLLRLESRTGWHFPQRADGVYAGYYPEDSAAAIAHLEELRGRGADFLAFPAPSAWWLEHYAGFAEHLETRYHRVLRDEVEGAIYALDAELAAAALELARAAETAEAEEPEPEPEPEPDPAPATDHDPATLAAARPLFDPAYYAAQAGRRFASADDALAHYLDAGHRDHDPNPYFDAAYYRGQHPELAASGANPLLHYLEGAPRGESSRPNPLFHDAYYRQTYPDVQPSGLSPLEHFLRHGAAERRYVSHIHRNIFDRLRESSVRSLLRGNWTRGTVLAFAGEAGPVAGVLDPLAHDLAAGHRLDTVVVAFNRPPSGEGRPSKLLVLEDYRLACDILRPSALRMLARTLRSLRPLFAVSDVPEAVHPLVEGGVGTYCLGAAAASATGHALAVAIDPPQPEGATALLERAARDFGLELAAAEAPVAAGAPRRRTRPAKVTVICSDWTVSGVNAALEAVGGELIRRGWDVEILFTRDRDFVTASAQGAMHLPRIPYRFLERTRAGLDGMWESLIADLQRSGPGIAFLAYDQVSNAVIPALGDDVGVVSWVQADDGDYYEQAYRLGRYCNAIVCVSSHIRDQVVALNPAVAERTHVIHNTSVGLADVASRRPRAANRMRLIYTGRLVQYQKRILDFVDLARALDRTGVPYEISLVGAFGGGGVQNDFEERAREHLDDARIRLLGRLPRAAILEQLTANAFFLLLSDFEGLPLSLVEAMASGCVPVVADSPSGIPEIVDSGRNGYILEGRDYDAWARLLVELWQDRPRMAGLSRNARRTVREEFTLERIGTQFDGILSAIADEIEDGRYERPPALTWGAERSTCGDVLPPPSLFLPATFARYPGLS